MWTLPNTLAMRIEGCCISWLLAWTLLGCQSPSVHPLPQGHVKGLVPQPQRVEQPDNEVDGRGMRCDGQLQLYWPQEWDVVAATDWMESAGWSWKRTEDVSQADVAWTLVEQDLGLEGYTLTVSEDRVDMTSNDAEGAFRAWTTLRQLMPAVCEQGCPTGFTLPALHVEDHAYLAHRGLLLDCCRHFMAPEFVKEIIDLLALQKMNVLHWHLTEDQGWRLPVKAYPKLTEVGGFRKEADGSVHGGFYTREDIRSILEHAAERHVTVIPEIELPGHCRAALAAYPWLGCTGDSLDVPCNWGVFKDVYCAGNDSTLAFMKTVLDEVCEMFPSEIIHIGGDEVPKVRWTQCAKCQAKIRRLGLRDEAELQTHFIQEMGAYLASKGRRIMGWDEILEGGLPQGAMVQSWRGMEGALEATHLGTDAVVSPTSHCYLDYPLRSTDLKEVYHFVPVPEAALDQPGSIVGGECNMWTERAPQNEVMAKVFPRATGLAEVLWSGPQVTQKEGAYATFLDRLDGLGQHWAFMGVEPGLEGVPVSLEISPSSQGALQISVLPALRKAGGMVHFAKDGDRVQSCKVGESMTIQGMGVVEVDVMMRGRATGVTETFPVAGHLAAHQPLSLGHDPSPSYTGGGAQALADGRRGSQDFRDGAWQAVQGDNMAVTVDLGEVKSLRSLHAQLYLYQDAWIFLPEQVLWSTSMDGVTFDLVGQSLDDMASLEPDPRQKTVAIDLPLEGRKARYVSMELVNPGVCPSWHDAATEPTWMFVDELVVLGDL